MRFNDSVGFAGFISRYSSRSPTVTATNVLSAGKLFLSLLVQGHHDTKTFQNQQYSYTAGSTDILSLCKTEAHFPPDNSILTILQRITHGRGALK